MLGLKTQLARDPLSVKFPRNFVPPKLFVAFIRFSYIISCSAGH